MTGKTVGRPLPPCTIEHAKDLVNRTRNSIPDRVEAGGFGGHSKLPFKLISLRETAVLRVLDLAESAIALHEDSRRRVQLRGHRSRTR
jgi:hypothetical protein